MQNYFNIYLGTYKRKSGIIKIGGINEFGREYKLNWDDYKWIVYEGEYLNGKRNGQGKEYFWSNKFNVIFEGVYLERKKWNGKGKELNDEGKVIFEGEYLIGEKNGNGKEF